MDEETLIKERKDRIFSFLKKKYSLISYVILAVIVFLAVKIRTRNLPGLKDITTGDWTLGPDLDPFLFLRWAKHIVENGTLFAIDNLRYVPFGYKTNQELLLHPYMIAWFHNILDFFNLSSSVTYSAIIYPVFFFAITIIAFFLFTRKLFEDSMGKNNASAIALIASLFLAFFPVLVPRTIAGIPEKESAAFFFMFMAFYLFLSAWKSKGRKSYIFAVLAGAFTAGMAFVWGGYGYIFLVIGLSTLIASLLGKIDIERIKSCSVWLIVSIILMIPSERYALKYFFISATTSPVIFALLASVVLLIIKKESVRNKLNLKRFSKIPEPLLSAIFTAVIGIALGWILFGSEQIKESVRIIIYNLTSPARSRLIQTVAENRQAYFTDWVGSFGPKIAGISLIFWLFFIGSVFLCYYSLASLKKKPRIILTASYLLFIISITFSRYSGSHILNGESGLSIFFYIIGPVVMLFFGIKYYLKDNKENSLNAFREIPYEAIFALSFLFLGLISARALIRLVMILAFPAAIFTAYFAVLTFANLKKNSRKPAYWIIFIIVAAGVIYSATSYYGESFSVAGGFVPSVYNQQWQKAMDWTRVNTQENAVFAHWWDYGYWIQSIGNRASVLDGGNAMSYWNHLMGRYALTGPSSKDSAEFLYAHNVTHFLIDSTEIGKYSAYSYIGSDNSLDRRSYISTFLLDDSQTRENKNSTISFYSGGFPLDEDIIYGEGEEKIFLPANSAGLGGIFVEKTSDDKIAGPPIGIFVYQGRQYNIPLKYAFYNGALIEFNSGIEAGVFIFPSAAQDNQGLNLRMDGALFYLSERVVKSQLARLYLYGEEDEYFKLAHKEDDFRIVQIKQFYPGFNSDFVYAGGFAGPIKIWELKYPGIEFKKEYLATEYPEELQFS